MAIQASGNVTETSRQQGTDWSAFKEETPAVTSEAMMLSPRMVCGGSEQICGLWGRKKPCQYRTVLIKGVGQDTGAAWSLASLHVDHT